MKESVYDTEISPLMRRIIEICKRERIALLASFCLDCEESPDLKCTTALVDRSEGFECPDEWSLALSMILGEGPSFRVRTLDDSGAVARDEVVVA